jgi:aspartate/methionine/tyrosine aminotransferase
MAADTWSTEGADEPVTRRIERLLDEYHPDDRLHLGGSIHVELPPHVREAVSTSMRAKGYTPSYGEAALREAIATELGDEGIAASVDQILVTSGAMHALDLVFRAVLRPGDEVLMPAPGFFISGLVRMAGARLVQFPSPFENGFRPAWSAAREYVSRRTKILYVNTPVNPTGYVFDDEDVAAAIELAHDAGLILVSDESLSHFVYGGRHHVSPVIGGLNAVPSVVIRSFSKDYAMPGMRVGYACLPDSLFDSVAAGLEWSVLCVSRPSQAAALAAMTGSRRWVDRMVAEAASRARRLVRAFDALPLLQCPPPAGGLNVFPHYDGDAEALAHNLVVRYGVPVAPGSAFGVTGHFRLQFGGRGQDLDLAMDHIRDAVR